MTLVSTLPSTGLGPVGQPSHLLAVHGGGRGRRQQDYRQQVRLGRTGRCPERPVNLIALFDSSGSVTGGNDPIGQRFLECEIAIEKVGTKCNCSEELVSVLHFDHPVANDIVDAALSDKDAISKALKTPYDGAGCSLMSSSLTTAYGVAAAHPDHRNVLIAFTDFQLFDPPSIWTQFEAFPGEIYACVLGGWFTGFDDNPSITVTKVERGSRPGAVAEAVFSALTKERETVRTKFKAHL